MGSPREQRYPAQVEIEHWQVAATGRTLGLLHAGLACCAVEIQAAQQRGDLLPMPENSERCDVLIVAGTITQAYAPGIEQALRMVQPSIVMAFGACATSGGPYWDAPSVVPGIDHLMEQAGLSLPTVTYVPGCPPDPRAFLEALEACVP